MTTILRAPHAGRRTPPARPTKPWSTVLPLAVAMAYVSGFWIISLRGSVGAIERTQTPFASWWRGSTWVLPLFVVAVLVAFSLAHRWFGPVPRGPKAYLSTAVLVAALGTVVGTGLLVASSAYDYHLQAQQSALKHAVGGTCVAGCQARELQATLSLQIHAVAVGVALLLVSNLVVVGWTLALRGGRLEVGSTRQRPRPGQRPDVQLLLGAALVAGAVVHAAVAAALLADWAAAAASLAALAAGELVVGVLVLLSPVRLVSWCAVAISLGPLLLWVCSRTVGLPFGPDIPEGVGLAGVAAGVLELAALLCAAALLRARPTTRGPSRSPHLLAIAFAGIVAVAAFGLAGSGLTVFNAFDLPVDQATSVTNAAQQG